MVKVESIEEYMARGGQIQVIQRQDIKPRRYAYQRTTKNIPLEERPAFNAERAKVRKAEVKGG